MTSMRIQSDITAALLIIEMFVLGRIVVISRIVSFRQSVSVSDFSWCLLAAAVIGRAILASDTEMLKRTSGKSVFWIADFQLKLESDLMM